MNNVTTIGIDLAKSVFQLCGLNQARKKVFNKQVKRASLLNELRRFPDAEIIMEACSSSHYWARTLQEMNFNVRLIPAQHIKALVRGNKNDANDALAIAEAAFRPDLHEVRVKTLEQQDIQALLRIRNQFKEARQKNANQLRGLLGEYGLVLPTGMSQLPKELPYILEDAENGLTVMARRAFATLLQQHRYLTERMTEIDRQLKALASEHPVCIALMRLRGVGPLSALALFASIGNGRQFKNARQLSAWLGLVPRQVGTGGKVRLGPISKRGNPELRTLMIHGARTVMNWSDRRNDQLSTWAKSLAERRGKHKAVVAVANKTARMVWVVLNKGVEALPDHYLAA